MKTIFALLFVLCVAAQIQTSQVALKENRRLGKLAPWAKNALKGMSTVIIKGVISCITQELIKKGEKYIKMIPGLKKAGKKLVGPALKKLSSRLSSLLVKAANSAIDNLRRRRRLFSLHSIASYVGGKFNDIKGAVKHFAGSVVGAVKKVGASVKKFAKQADKLTGGKLSTFLGGKVCPVITQGIDKAAAAALASIGWPLGLPACFLNEITKGCKKAVKAGFKRYMRRRLNKAICRRNCMHKKHGHGSQLRCKSKCH